MGREEVRARPSQRSERDYKVELLNQSLALEKSFFEAYFDFISRGLADIKSIKFYSHFKCGCHSSPLFSPLSLCHIENIF